MTDRRPPPSNSVGANDDCLYRSRSTTPLIRMRVDPKNIGRPFSKGSDDEDTAAGDDEPTEPVEEEDSMDELEQRQQKISNDLLSNTLSENMRLQQFGSSKKVKLRQSPSELGPPEACTISASKASLRITNKMKALRYFSSSKYDFVKVKVLLLSHDCDGSSKMHVSILSRYIIRRILTSVDVRWKFFVLIRFIFCARRFPTKMPFESPFS